MKSPDTLRQRLKRLWHRGEERERLLLDPRAWPLELAIGKPSAALLTGDIAAVRSHIQQWRRVVVGEVEWRPVSYRSTAAAVELPMSWRLHTAGEWVEAVADEAIRREYQIVARLVATIDPLFWPLVIRQRQQILSRGVEESSKACEVALALSPGCADGRPLRALSVAGCDSKFFERNRTLLVKLLELRFGTVPLEQGLEHFLGALDESEHWLLVVPLAPGLLTFPQQRVRSSDLARTPLSAERLLIVENERSLYQLPPLADTVAILGGGLNLSWMQGHWLADKRIAYWGDIDTWGLTMLALARSHQPTLTPLLMDRATFDVYSEKCAVAEPVTAGSLPPSRLSEEEGALYRHLLQLEKGRLEQEFIAETVVKMAVCRWHATV